MFVLVHMLSANSSQASTEVAACIGKSNDHPTQEFRKRTTEPSIKQESVQPKNLHRVWPDGHANLPDASPAKMSHKSCEHPHTGLLAPYPVEAHHARGIGTPLMHVQLNQERCTLVLSSDLFPGRKAGVKNHDDDDEPIRTRRAARQDACAFVRVYNWYGLTHTYRESVCVILHTERRCA
jgi:hypothetical protein